MVFSCKRFFIGVSVVCLLVSLLFSAGVYAHGDEEHNELPSKVNVCHSLLQQERRACYLSLCEGVGNAECIEDVIGAAVSGSGSEFAFAVLVDLLIDPPFALPDEYILAQEIGRHTALQRGFFNGDAFLTCSSDFHYGCYYGFFKEVLSKNDVAPLNVVTSICGSVSDAALQEMCYHKVGHVFMKHSEYVLNTALSLCDSLESRFQSHCWDGVFMERVNDMLFVDSFDFGLLDLSPLFPCNEVSDVYQEMCYKNHGRYLSYLFQQEPLQGDGVDPYTSSLKICSLAGKHVRVCEHSVMDVISDAEDHHTHDAGDDLGDTVGDVQYESVESESRSWWQRIFDFVRSLFGFFGGEGRSTSRDLAQFGGEMLSLTDDEFFFSDSPSDVSVVRNAGDSAVIVYRNAEYVPATVEISVGGTVTWVNESSVFWPASDLHPTHRKYPGSNITKCGTPEQSALFDACEAMGPGAEYSFTFTEVGEWDFHDHINPRATGTVVVNRI